MPLLDRLKTGISPPAPSGMSLPEEWISLSAAIGMDIDRQALPQSSGFADGLPRGVEDGTGVEDDTLWPELLSICEQGLVDKSVVSTGVAL